MPDQQRPFPPVVQEVIAEFLPICHSLAVGRYAISVGGSLGKGTWDQNSDIDFRLFCDDHLPWDPEGPGPWQVYRDALAAWGQKGVRIDGVWVRKIAEIDTSLSRWIAGEIVPVELVWAVWGYQLLPDIYHQSVIEDPFGVIRDWKERLSVYPPRLKAALLARHGESLRYWRGDYHFRHKVERGDAVFLASLTARLIHDLIQVLFALNETYYVGDGSNLTFIERLAIQPPDFSARVSAVLYPPSGPARFREQYERLCALIDEVLAFLP